ncbi:site-specific integrase [Alphaproteobacteria bacterium]|nr:site-specific integrase [Alphaproteobacteria bacterium]
MRLDDIAKGKNNRGETVYYFTYYCPEKLKIRQFKTINKAKALAKRKNLQKAQRYAPDSPEAAITPFGVVLEKYEQDRKNDVLGGRLREATFVGYVQHLKRLHPLGAEEVTLVDGAYRFRHYKKDIGRFVVAKFKTKEEAEAKREAINLTAASNDPLYYDKLNALEAPIQNLKWEFIQKVLDHIDRSQGTRKNHFVTFNNIINWAIKKGYLYKTQKDMLSHAKPAKGKKKKIEIPEEASVKQFIEMSNDFWKPFWIISATTGARVSELTALKWQNVHLNEGRIYIEASTQRNGRIDAPKTQNAYRELPIGAEVINYLSRLPRNTDLVWPCPEFGPAYWHSNQFGRTCFVEPRRLRQQNEERPMKTEEVFRIGMQPILREHQLKWKGPIHSLRHFAASRMIDKNWNIKRIQTRLGHANATTTLDVYGHLMERQSFHQEAEELIEGLLNNNSVQ